MYKRKRQLKDKKMTRKRFQIKKKTKTEINVLQMFLHCKIDVVMPSSGHNDQLHQIVTFVSYNMNH